jgi:hypothetical protein
MAAGAPKGSMPEEKEVTSNVDIQDDSAHLSPNEDKMEDTSITEDDLKEFSEEQKVPYNRFKSVNEKKKELESRIAELEQNQNATLQSTIAQYEAKLQAVQGKSREDDFGIVYEDEPVDGRTKQLEQEVQELKGRLNEVSEDYKKTQTQTKLEKLQGKYPEADSMAVLGWNKVLPSADLEELMEKSHRDNMARKEQAIKDLIAKKKAKARQVVPVNNLGIKLKEEDRPKSLKESSRLLKEYLNS